MKVTVIIPVYNRLEHLRAAFLCLIRQKIKPDELIITDDGSSQNVLDYIEDLIYKVDFKIKHVYQKDEGFRKARALNNAVRNSTGELLVFCDQDLIFPEDYIETIINKIQKGNFLMERPINTQENERNLIMKELEKVDNYEKIVKIINKKNIEIKDKLLRKDFLRYLLHKVGVKKRGVKLVGMSYSLFKNDYIKVNGYDENYKGWGKEDDDFGNRLSVAGIIGKTFKTKKTSLHLWHKFDSSKKMSANDEYYSKRKKEIFKKSNYKCVNGFYNSIDNDKVEVKIIK